MSRMVLSLVAVTHVLGMSYGQTPPTAYGTEFIGIFPPARTSQDRSGDCFFYINTYNETTNVVIQSTSSSTSESIAARSTFVYSNEGCTNRATGNVEDKAYRITSDKPISVMAVSEFGDLQLDATLLYPVDNASTEFYLFSYQPPTNDSTFGSCGNLTDVASFYVLGAAEDDTSVEIFSPPDYTASTTVLLQSFQTYMTALPVFRRTSGYTGYYVVSDKPILVISGTLCADATLSPNVAEGIAWSAMPPVASWVAGDYLTYEVFSIGAFGDPQKNHYRVNVVAQEDDTLVSFAGAEFLANRGQTVSYQFIDTYEMVNCNKPCMVIQTKENFEVPLDPQGIFQLQISAVEWHGTFTAFTTHPIQVGNLPLYFVRVVTMNDQDFRDIVITGPEIEEPGWECKDLIMGGRACSIVAQINDNNVQSVIESSNPAANFSVAVYWTSITESGKGYGFNAGTFLRG